MADTAWLELNHLALIKISGADARTFLAGQFANDVDALTSARSQLGCWCTPQGRVISTFWLFQQDSGYALLLPRELAEGVIKRLSMYVLRSDVTVAAADARVLGLLGETSLDVLQAVGFEPPAVANEVTHSTGGFSHRAPGVVPRFTVITDSTTPAGMRLAEILDPQAPVQQKIWARAEIQAGVPQITAPTSEAFVPQMLNLNVLGAMNLQKGCYPGQEIIARLHFRGELKKRLYRAAIEGHTAPTPGATLVDQTGANCGTVINAVSADDHNPVEMLAVVNIAAQAEPVYFDERVLEWEELPYTLS